jgi:aerobic-type carbon monoxide dehydrogenase small subunit (CoxS/CutS family)
MKKTGSYPLEVMVNGEWKGCEVTSDETLIHVLREKLGHTEVKEGCGKGDCGACAVLLDGKAVNACLTLALQTQKHQVITLKGIGNLGKPHPIQTSFVKHGAIQCGFCTAGMIISAKSLLDKNCHFTRDEIRSAIAGNLCRCTGYIKIIDAIEEAARNLCNNS